MSEPGVLIRRLVAHARVPSGSASGATVRAALEEDLGGPLERAVAATARQGYWLIRTLEVRTCVGADWTAAQMAEVVARSVGEAVGGRARRGRDAADVLWFPDRATFWAQYLLDLARGRVGGRWEYADLDPGPSWSGGAAALARRDATGLAEALQRLTTGELDELVGRVDADPLVELLADGTGTPVPVLAALRLLREQGRLAVGRSTGLLLAVTALTAPGGHGDPAVRLAAVARAALDVAVLVRLVSAAGAGAPRLLADVAEGRWAEVARASGGDDFLDLVRWPAPERAQLVAAFAGRAAAASPERVHTRFGGALVLLPLLPELWSWRTATAAWPEVAGVSPDRLARLGVLAAAMGSARFDAALEDEALRIVLDVPGGVDVADWLCGLDPVPFCAATGLDPDAEVDPWLAAIPPFLGVAAAAALRDLGRRLPGMATASPAYLWHNVLDLEAWVSHEAGEPSGTVELGHAPMGVLLAVSGVGRGEFTVEGAGSRRWTLGSRS